MRYIITHGHIFKNAGTTFDYALEKAFGKDFCDHRDDLDMRRGGEAYLKQYILDNPNLKAISSHHLCNPLPKADEFTCIPVYFVRNPIERIISVYNFERKQKKGSLGAEMAAKLSLNDYIRWRMTPDAPKVIFDYQTAYIGRTRNLRPNERVSSAMLQRAIKMIEDSNIYVGTVERFDESFQYITSQLKTYFPEVEFQYKRKNVTNSSSLDDKYSRALKDMTPVLSEVIGRNAYDMALYEAADQKLDELLKKSA